VDRDVRDAPHAGGEFTRSGRSSRPDEPERKKPFDIRSVLRAVADADHPPLERWVDMLDAENVVVYDAHLGGHPVALLGIESRPAAARPTPMDGPTTFTGGTLIPRSSKKTARAINAASGNRPLVVLANLSGFDGSPSRWRQLQLEYGAEIGPARVNFDGADRVLRGQRYHGGAFVVFSGTLNESMEVAAVEGSYASVIGGAPAAAVVFAGEVEQADGGRPAGDGPGARIAKARDRAEARPPGWRRSCATVRRRALGEAGRGRGGVRRGAQRRARPPHGLGAPDRPVGGPAPVPGGRGPPRDGRFTG
jgi:acetyl-CoA carboxylase carboxyltransferase component